MSTTKTTPAQIAKLEAEARRAGFKYAADAALAAGLTDRKGRRPDIRFDITKQDASVLIDQLIAGDLVPEPETPDLSHVATDELVAELARRGVKVQ